MDRVLSLYVSASPEMDAECELLGQILASMPKSMEWVIKRTPGPFEHSNPDMEALSSSQFYVILLGTDITAPIGVELRAALGLGLSVLAYRDTTAVVTPAAAVFARQSSLAWRGYESPQDFGRQFEGALITQLIEGTPGYGLDLSEIGELSARLRALEDDTEGPETEDRRGAGRGGVILASMRED